MEKSWFKIIFYFNCSLFIILGSTHSMGQENVSIHLTENKEHIFLLQLYTGLILQESLIVYESSTGWYIPLSELVESLGLGIKVAPVLGRAEGFIINEPREFLLENKYCKAGSPGKQESYSCQNVIVTDEEIYVHQELIEQWFPVKIRFDPLGLVATLTPSENLPIQSKFERKKRMEKLLKTKGYQNPGFKFIEVERKWLDGFFIDQQLSSKSVTKEGETEVVARHNTRLVGEVATFDTTLTMSGDTKKNSTAYVFMTRKDLEGRALGSASLLAKEVSLVDVSFKTLPLITNPLRGQGVTISSFDLKRATNFGSHDFTGELRDNWEVELYQNGVLLDRQDSNKSGRYAFNEVPLVYNLNKFRLTFYGPHGEQYDEFVDFNINPNLKKKNRFDYRVGYSKSEQEDDQYFTQLNYGINKKITTSVTAASFTPQFSIDPKTYTLFSLFGYLGKMSYSLSRANSGGDSYANELQLNWRSSSYSLGGVIRKFKDFKSNLYNTNTVVSSLRSQSKFNFIFTTGWLPVRLNTTLSEDLFTNDSYIKTLNNRATTYLQGIRLSNNFSLTDNGETNFFGEFEASLSRLSMRYIFGQSYGKNGVTGYRASTRCKVSQKFSVQAGASYFPSIRETVVTGSAAYYFKNFSLSLDGSYTDNKKFTIGFLFNYSFGMDSNRDLHLLNKPQASQGGLVVNVFKDNNDNSINDEGDDEIKGVLVKLNNRLSKGTVNDRGQIFIPKLSTYHPLDVSVSTENLDDPLLSSAVKGYRIIPRPGKIKILSFPIISKSEIEGFVTLKVGSKEKELVRIKVHLLDKNANLIETIRTDSDGFYIFQAVNSGTYQLRLDDEQLEQLGFVPEFNNINLKLSSSGTFAEGKNFILRNKE